MGQWGYASQNTMVYLGLPGKPIKRGHERKTMIGWCFNGKIIYKGGIFPLPGLMTLGRGPNMPH